MRDLSFEVNNSSRDLGYDAQDTYPHTSDTQNTIRRRFVYIVMALAGIAGLLAGFLAE